VLVLRSALSDIADGFIREFAAAGKPAAECLDKTFIPFAPLSLGSRKNELFSFRDLDRRP